jgi:hypothetical protein
MSWRAVLLRYWPRRDANHRCVRCNIRNNRRTRADHGPITDPDAVPDTRPESNPSAFTDRNIAAKVRPWRNMHTIAKHTIMIDRCPGIDDASRPEVRASVDSRTGKYNRARPQYRAITYYRRRVNDRRYRDAKILDLRQHFHPPRIVADCHNTCVPLLHELCQIVTAANDALAAAIIKKRNAPPPTHATGRVRYDSTMSTCAKNEQPTHDHHPHPRKLPRQ